MGQRFAIKRPDDRVLETDPALAAVHLQRNTTGPLDGDRIALRDRLAIHADYAMATIQKDLHQVPLSDLCRQAFCSYPSVDATGGVLAVGDVFDLDLKAAIAQTFPAEEDTAIG